MPLRVVRVFKMLRRFVLMLLTILRRLSSDADKALAAAERQRLFALKQRTERSDDGFFRIGIFNERDWPFALDRLTPRLLITRRADGKAFFVVGPLRSMYVSDESFDVVNSNTRIGNDVEWGFRRISPDKARITFVLSDSFAPGSPTAEFTLESEGVPSTAAYTVAFDNRLGTSDKGLAGAPGEVTTMLAVTERLNSDGLTYEFTTNGVKFIHAGELPGHAFERGIRWLMPYRTNADDVEVAIVLNMGGGQFYFRRQ